MNIETMGETVSQGTSGGAAATVAVLKFKILKKQLANLY